MKTQTTKRALSAALLCSLLCASAASCGAQTTEKPVSTAAPDAAINTVAVTDAVTEPELINLPKDLDYNGTSITVLGWETYEDVEFYAENENGEVVNDAVFARNLAVSERLNVSLTFLEQEGRSGDNNWINKVSNTNKAGDAAYDIVAGHSINIGSLVHKGDLLNLLDYDYLSLNQPWWREELTNRATILGKLYFATGDISPSSIARTQGIFFNTDILNQFDLEDPYQLVVDGNWTFAKLKEMSTGIYADLDSDGKHNEAGDRFGFAIDSVQLQAVAPSHNIISVEAGEDGRLGIPASYMSDRTVNIVDAWISLVKGEDSVLIKVTDDATVFRSGRALFYAFPLGLISSELRDVKFNIGFVPYPKFDEQQKDYITCTSNAYSLWGIPLAAADPMRSAAIMEALGYEGYMRITPAIFETAYKVKYNTTGSELQSQVFDILRSNLVFDIGRILQGSGLTGSIFGLVPNAIAAGKNNLASKYASTEKSTIKALDKWMDQLETLG